jgi:hypothetical protein
LQTEKPFGAAKKVWLAKNGVRAKVLIRSASGDRTLRERGSKERSFLSVKVMLALNLLKARIRSVENVAFQVVSKPSKLLDFKTLEAIESPVRRQLGDNPETIQTPNSSTNFKTNPKIKRQK